MCGIAGILDLRGRPVADAEIKAMIDSIRHRGPDDEGHYVGDGVALGNRRLAIIDTSRAGHQPMATEDGSLLIVYNGELYNFPELMPLLEAHGHRFQSRTDTEVVLHAYEEWGPACLERFNGMFGFAIWDTRRRRLFLARDRFGIKPLYYSFHERRFLFASEIKALLQAGLPRRVSPEALVEYFTFQNVLSDLTLFDGVRILPAGHSMTVSEDGVQIQRFWDLEPDPDESVSEAEWAERIRGVFEESVTRQLISDVPVGSYLSGGMDSGSIVAVASEHVPRLMTFTGGFDLSSVEGLELVFDERADAESVASQFKTQHYEMVMHAGDLAWVLPELVWHLEELRVGMSYQNYYIAGLASKFVKVSLAGAGGDELFAGYPWRYDLVEAGADEFDSVYYDYWARLVPDANKAEFFAPEVWAQASAHAPYDVFRDVLSPVETLDPLTKALYFEAKTFLHGLLVVEDKVSMAHSLEARVPFLDNELVDLAVRIPSRLKHADGGGKRLLRQAMKGLLPDEIIEKQKQGFSPPDQSWYRGPTMDYIREILLDPRSLNRGYFQPAYVIRILEEHVHGRINHRLLIWSLLCFEWWNRLFMDGDGAALGRAGEAARLSEGR
ncbi:MAG: asparagine synthase (glutamine-hydrolyzing) [Actinomycetota bacterium]|nr:asparagine synthase (glutamine-hydrolyzing) [Actinomycetota bacterium]